MKISKPCKLTPSPQQKSGVPGGLARMSATLTRNGKGCLGHAAVCSTGFLRLLNKFDQNGWSWKMSRVSSVQMKAERLRQLSTSSKKSGIWGYGLRVTFSMRAYPTIGKEYSLLEVIDRKVFTNSILTAANCLGILRRERRARRKLDPLFQTSLLQTLRFWYNVAEALGLPRQKVIVPRYAPKLGDIRGVIQTGQFYVARNLTWNECERLTGFPEGWTVAEGDSLATPSPRQSLSLLAAESWKSNREKIKERGFPPVAKRKPSPSIHA